MKEGAPSEPDLSVNEAIKGLEEAQDTAREVGKKIGNKGADTLEHIRRMQIGAEEQAQAVRETTKILGKNPEAGEIGYVRDEVDEKIDLSNKVAAKLANNPLINAEWQTRAEQENTDRNREEFDRKTYQNVYGVKYRTESSGSDNDVRYRIIDDRGTTWTFYGAAEALAAFDRIEAFDKEQHRMDKLEKEKEFASLKFENDRFRLWTCINPISRKAPSYEIYAENIGEPEELIYGLSFNDLSDAIFKFGIISRHLQTREKPLEHNSLEHNSLR